MIFLLCLTNFYSLRFVCVCLIACHVCIIIGKSFFCSLQGCVGLAAQQNQKRFYLRVRSGQAVAFCHLIMFKIKKKTFKTRARKSSYDDKRSRGACRFNNFNWTIKKKRHENYIISHFAGRCVRNMMVINNIFCGVRHN